MSVSRYLSYFKLHFLKNYAGFCFKGIGRKERLHRGFHLKLPKILKTRPRADKTFEKWDLPSPGRHADLHPCVTTPSMILVWMGK